MEKHPSTWNKNTHYGMCGQSCPCCRAKIETVPFGTCTICWAKKTKSKSH